MTSNTAGEGTITIRFATEADLPALARLAQLDSAIPPATTTAVLVADVAGELRAAIPLDGRWAIADPFRPTASIVELLRARAAALAPAERPRRRRLLAALRPAHAGRV